MPSNATASDATDSVALYLNSNLEDSANSTANKVDFRLQGPINSADGVYGYVTLSQFSAFNTFASISAHQQNNVVKCVNVMYNAITGVYDYTTYMQRYVIPDNRYTAVTLFALLNGVFTRNQLLNSNQGQNWYSQAVSTDIVNNPIVYSSYLYLGFGFNGQNNLTCTTPVQGFSLNPDDEGRMVISPAAVLGSTNGNPYTKIYTSGSIQNDPFVYAGIYLVSDSETAGFMSSLGFIGKDVVAQYIPNTPLQGFGFTFPTTINPVPPQAPLAASFAYQLFGPWLLYFCLDALTVNTRCNDESLDQSNIIGTIPVEAFYGGLISYHLTMPESQRFKSPPDFTNFMVSIYDQNKRLVDFRGGSWTAKLDFNFVQAPDYNLIEEPDVLTRADPRSSGNLHKRSNPDGSLNTGRNIHIRFGRGGGII
jgi:hypothetical protein